MNCFRKSSWAAMLLTSMHWSCASPPPESAPISRTGGGDATVADSPCTPGGKAALVSAGASSSGVEKLCGYQNTLVSSEYVYKGTGDAKVLMQQIDGLGEEISPSTESSTTAKLVSYSGLLVPSGDIAAIVDVMRMQSFFPTDFKSRNFEVDSLLTYSPAGQPAAGFNTTSYNFRKTGSDGLGDVHYDGTMRIVSFSDGSFAVVDKLDKKVSGSLEQYNGVVFYFSSGSGTAVIGRSEQTLQGQNQTGQTVATNVRSQIGKTLTRDFKNYSRAQEARQFMDGKRSSNGSN